MSARRWLVVGGVTAALASTGLTAGGAIAETTTRPPAAAASSDRTSAAESRKVDAVPAPELAWAACFEIAELLAHLDPSGDEERTLTKVCERALPGLAGERAKQRG